MIKFVLVYILIGSILAAWYIHDLYRDMKENHDVQVAALVVNGLFMLTLWSLMVVIVAIEMFEELLNRK